MAEIFVPVMTQIKVSKSGSLNMPGITLFYEDQVSKLDALEKQQISFIKKEIDNNQELVCIQELPVMHYYIPVKRESINADMLEKFRVKGSNLLRHINGSRYTEVCIINETGEAELSLAVAEGLALSNYQFLKYIKAKTLSGL